MAQRNVNRTALLC